MLSQHCELDISKNCVVCLIGKAKNVVLVEDHPKTKEIACLTSIEDVIMVKANYLC